MPVRLRERKLKSGESSFFLDIAFQGKRYYEWIENLRAPARDKHAAKEVRALAEQFRMKRALELAADSNALFQVSKARGDFFAFLDQVAATKQGRNRHNHTYLRKHLHDFTGGKLSFGGLSVRWLESFKAYLLTILKPNSASTYFKSLKAMLRLAYLQKFLKEDVGAGVKGIAAEETRRAYLSIEEIQRLDETPCIDPHLGRAFLLCCFTGLRYSDVSTITWANVIEADGVPVVLQFKQQKTGSHEALPLAEQARRYLAEQKAQAIEAQTYAPQNPVFSLSSASAGNWYHLKNWIARAGIDKHISFHCSRKTATVLLLTSGASIYTASQLLGHSSVAITERHYADLPTEAKLKAMAAMPALALPRPLLQAATGGHVADEFSATQTGETNAH